MQNLRARGKDIEEQERWAKNECKGMVWYTLTTKSQQGEMQQEQNKTSIQPPVHYTISTIVQSGESGWRGNQCCISWPRSQNRPADLKRRSKDDVLGD